MMSLNVAECMTCRPVCLSKDSQLTDALKLMASRNIGSILISDGEVIDGILTERDILGMVAYGKKMSGTLYKFMSDNVIGISPQAPITDAVSIFFENHFRRLPVVDKGSLKGILTVTDLTFCMDYLHIVGVVDDYMDPDLVFINKEENILDAARKMMDNTIGGLLVGDSKNLDGIISERDILRKVAAVGVDTKTAKVADIMTTRLITLPLGTKIRYACQIMHHNSIRRFPIVDKSSTVVGMMTERDILKAVIDSG